jgi:hypothetical protein
MMESFGDGNYLREQFDEDWIQGEQEKTTLPELVCSNHSSHHTYCLKASGKLESV